ncbi:MAG: hypothetical protein IJ085_08525 [Turicibacter sp.]|nr:hypothetical protein [Turicibacter sp.]
MAKEKLKGVVVSTEPKIDESSFIEEVSVEELNTIIAQSEEPQPVKKPIKPKAKKVEEVEVEEVEEVEDYEEEDDEEPVKNTKVQEGEVELMKSKQEFLDEAKAYLGNVVSFLSSFQYEQNLNRLSAQYNVPKQQIAQGFLSRIFAVISDVFGIVIETVRYSVKTVVNFISQALQAGTDLICNLALSLSRILTFNQGR